MIQAGFQPAQQAQGLQPFRLPYEQLYQHMANKNQMAGLLDQQATEALTALGGIKDVLPEDRPLINRIYSDALKTDEELRASVDGDLLNPDYKKGLNKLLMGIANNQTIADAMFNYNVDLKQQEFQQKMESTTGQPLADWNNPYAMQRAKYVNAEESGRLKPSGILGSKTTYYEDSLDAAKQLAVDKYNIMGWDPNAVKDPYTGKVLGGGFVTASGEVLTKEEIIQSLMDMEDNNLSNKASYAELYRKSNYLGEDFNTNKQDVYEQVANALAYEIKGLNISGVDSKGLTGGDFEEDEDGIETTLLFGFDKDVLGESNAVIDGLEAKRKIDHLEKKTSSTLEELKISLGEKNMELVPISQDNQDAMYTSVPYIYEEDGEGNNFILNYEIKVGDNTYSLDPTSENSIYRNVSLSTEISDKVLSMWNNIEEIEALSNFDQVARSEEVSGYTGEVSKNDEQAYFALSFLNTMEALNSVSDNNELFGYLKDELQGLFDEGGDLQPWANVVLRNEGSGQVPKNTLNYAKAMLTFLVKTEVLQQNHGAAFQSAQKTFTPEYSFNNLIDGLEETLKGNPELLNKEGPGGFKSLQIGLTTALNNYFKDHPEKYNLQKNALIDAENKTYKQVNADNDAFSNYIKFYKDHYGSLSGGKLIRSTATIALNTTTDGKKYQEAIHSHVMSDILEGSIELEDAQTGKGIEPNDLTQLKESIRLKGTEEAKAVGDYINYTIAYNPSSDNGKATSWQLYVSLPDPKDENSLKMYRIKKPKFLETFIETNNLVGNDKQILLDLNSLTTNALKNKRNGFVEGNLKTMTFLGSLEDGSYREIPITTHDKKIDGRIVPKHSFKYTIKTGPDAGKVVYSEDPIQILSLWYYEKSLQEQEEEPVNNRRNLPY
jgi:hypothetical protein